MKRPFLAVSLCVLLGCPSKPAPAGDPAWLVSAKKNSGPIADEAVKARKDATKVDDEDRKAIDAMLDRASSSGANAAGVESAAQIIQEGEKLGKGADAPRLARTGGMAVLADLVRRACDAKPNDSTVVDAIDRIKLPDEQNREKLKMVAVKCGARMKEPIGP